MVVLHSKDEHVKPEMVIECQKCKEGLYGVDAASTVQYFSNMTCPQCGTSGFRRRYDARTGKMESTGLFVWCKGECGKEMCGWSGCKACHTAHVLDSKRAEKANTRKARKAARGQ
jgi:hypothetical protein